MKTIIAICIALLLGGTTRAQEALKRVYGVVMTEAGEPVANVMVSVEGKDKFSMTNAEGVFTFAKLTTADSLLVIVPKFGMMKVACQGGKMEIVVGKEADSSLKTSDISTETLVLSDHRLHGTVKVKDSEETVPFATVLVSDVEDKVVGHGATDSIGHFDMQVRGTGNYTVRISSVGYTDSYFPLRFSASDTVLSAGVVSMIEGVTLGEVEVTDRRAEKGKRIYSNVLTRSDIEATGAKDFISLLQGSFSGIRVSRSNMPGGRAGVRIRGNSSIMLSSSPLVIVDDVQIPGEDAIQTINNAVAIEMIESVEVNKTGAGYGMQGANGVIIVKTRRGK